MGLKNQEKELMKRIKDDGFVRYVRHERFEEPIESLNMDGKTFTNIGGITFVLITPKNVREHTRILFYEDMTDNDDYAWVKDQFQQHSSAIGYSICDVKDTYHKRLGRVIATGRALEQLSDLLEQLSYINGD